MRGRMFATQGVTKIKDKAEEKNVKKWRRKFEMRKNEKEKDKKDVMCQSIGQCAQIKY